MECPPRPFQLCLQPYRHMTCPAALRPGNASVISRNLPYRGNSQRNRIAKIKIPTPMNNIAPSVAISASPAVLAVPLRDCDVYYPTFSFFPRPRCAVDRCTLVTVKCKFPHFFQLNYISDMSYIVYLYSHFVKYSLLVIFSGITESLSSG